MSQGEEYALSVRAALRPAEGFHELGMWEEAWRSIDALSLAAKSHPLAVLLQLDVLLASHRLTEAATIGLQACERWPVVDGFVIKTVAALLDLASYAKAKEILLDGPHSLRQKAAFWFDLARCQCQLGEVEAAMKSIGVCIDRDGRFKKEILECADLEAIWQMWKRKDSR